jgi:hypothetical protein
VKGVYMKWPRGRCNGLRIVEATVVVNVLLLNWMWFLPSRYNRAIGLGPIVRRFEFEYESRGAA